MKTKAKDAPWLHISHERNESENIPIFVEERGDASPASPSLDAWVSLNIYLGCLGHPQAWSLASLPKRIRKHTDICWRKRGCLPSIPKLRRLSLLEYLLGVPRASPSLISCLSSFSSYRDILDQTLHPHKTSTENSVRSVSIIKQITTLSTVANQFIFCFCIVSTVI